jgi:hypothetical protein
MEVSLLSVVWGWTFSENQVLLFKTFMQKFFEPNILQNESFVFLFSDSVCVFIRSEDA